jgi:hypothetical protein
MMTVIAVALMSVTSAGEPAKCAGATCSSAPRKVVTINRTRTTTKSCGAKVSRKKRCCR